jgi:hypothetical protein
MAGLMILRHAERSRISNLHDVLHARITKRGKESAKALGKRMSKFFKDESINVMASQLDRCKETAKAFASGYGKSAKYMGTEQKGTLSYLFPGMSEYINLEGFCESRLSEIYGSVINTVPRMFEHDYAGTIGRWLDGEFNNMMISPIDMYQDLLHLAGRSEGKAFLLFASDVQVSMMGAIHGMQELVERRPEYLHGIWTEDRWKEKWKVFCPNKI